MRLALTCIGLALAGTPAVAGTQDDSAFKFAANLMLGNIEEASKLILEPVAQDTENPAVRGKETLSTPEFIGAVGRCSILEVRNRAPSSISYEVPADLRVVWDCGAYAVDARVKSVVYNVEISGLRTLPFVPSIPVKPAKPERRN